MRSSSTGLKIISSRRVAIRRSRMRPMAIPQPTIDPKAKLLAVLDQAEDFRGLAIRAKDRGEREVYERIVELYVEIAEELEGLIDG
jgi:hypothetical protein